MNVIPGIISPDNIIYESRNTKKMGSQAEETTNLNLTYVDFVPAVISTGQEDGEVQFESFV